MTRALVLNRQDSVATLIDNGAAGEECELRGESNGRIRLSADVPYGHKVAIKPIAKGALVVKYGEKIGRATAAICIGEHVHVHNVESLRGRGDLHQTNATGAGASQ